MFDETRIPRRLPLLVVPDGVLLPGASMRFLAASPGSLALVRNRLLSKGSLGSTVVGILPKAPNTEEDETSLENRVGAAAVVVQVTGTTWPRPAYSLLVTGLCRIWVDRVLQQDPFPLAVVTPMELAKVPSCDDEHGKLLTRMELFKEKAFELLELMDNSLPTVTRLRNMLNSLPVEQLADLLASIVKASYPERLDILNAVSLEERFEKALPLLQRQIEGLKLVQEKKMKKMEDKAAKPKRGLIRVLGDVTGSDWQAAEEGEDDIEDLEKRLRELDLPPKVVRTAARELKRLRKMSPQMPEYPMLRHYLELIAELPWSTSSQDRIDIAKARADLDSEHHALGTVKRRILEYLAVRKLNSGLRGPILCFLGPPGVGKTSIGKSIAKTLGREFQRISLGGVSDQSDIRGHRRTYIGAMPGRIIQGLKAAGTNNPVFLLDEIDKMTVGIHGDPAAALLEVLDPEQNANFVDHYLNVPFDLSQVLFIATANSLATLSRPLLDRMEIIPLAGYSQEDKLPIAGGHLLPRQMGEHGIAAEQLHVPEDSLKFIIGRYTREAGVRSLERQLATLCRAVAVRLAEEAEESDNNTGVGANKKRPVNNMNMDEEQTEDAQAMAAKRVALPLIVTEEFVQTVLGEPRYEDELSGRLGVPGVALGLAWTTVGGETMVVEASRMPAASSSSRPILSGDMFGGGKLQLTGQLGGVMQESAALALSWIRCNAAKLGLDGAELLAHQDIHLHFPAGAVNKDGPSAGVTIVTALVSLLTERPVRQDLAMTGEITLRGLVLPVGGVRDKVLAAHRVGLTTVILPRKNLKDLKEVPEAVITAMSVVGVDTLEEVLQAAFPAGFPLIFNQNTFTELSKL